MPVLNPFLSVVKNIDKIIFLLINHDSDHAFFDSIMVAIRNPYTWIPLYAFLLWYSLNKIRAYAIHFIFLSIAVFTITDLTCYRIIKPYFQRFRPCNDPEMFGLVRSLVDCGEGYSFPSNHAANHFGLATFWFLYIKKLRGKQWHWVWLWSAIICYAQIYVGKHYPIDIIAGALFGILSGILIFNLRHYSPCFPAFEQN